MAAIKAPRWRTLAAMAFLMALGSSQTLLTTMSKKDGVYAYNFASVPLLAEALKMVVCIAFFCSLHVRGKSPKMTWSASALFLQYSVPSIIYAALNNIHFRALFYLSPPSFQLIGNLKIVTTAVLFRFFLKRKLAPQRWLALLLLTLGTTLSEMRLSSNPQSRRQLLLSYLTSPWQGLAWALLGTWLSAAAGVFTEFLMKKTDDSIFWQNTQLYICGIVANSVSVCLSSAGGGQSSQWKHLLDGYNSYTWLLVANMTLTGLSVSWIMKFADVLVKVYATSMSLLLTSVLSAVLFNLMPTLELSLGIAITCGSLFLYFRPLAPVPKSVLLVE